MPHTGDNLASTGRLSSSTSPGRSRRLSLWAIPASGAALAVAFLLVAVPVVGAGGSSISFSAPYKQLAKVYSSSVNSWGCHAYANDPVTPAINTVWGNITSWQRSVAGNCNSGTVWASTSTDLGFTGPKWTASSTGSVTVTVTWSMKWSARASAMISSGTSTATASATLAMGSYVVDTTAGQNLWGTGTNNLTLAALSTTDGTLTAHVSTATTYTMSFTINVVKGDWYMLDTEIFGTTYDTSSMCDQTAWSQVDYGSSGHFASLVSVTVG